jgi:hypothetical protein
MYWAILQQGPVVLRDFPERLTHHRGRIASLTADIEALERQLKPNQLAVTPEIIGRFGTLLRDELRGDNPALHQAADRSRPC